MTVEENNFVDKFGRKISYLRVSVTDRCNLKCIYCHDDKSNFIDHNDILRFEEIMDLLELFVEKGVKKIRFTGGEPFVRKGFDTFLERVRIKFPDIKLHLTTNGLLLAPYINLIKELFVPVNISLDSLDAKNFFKITGSDSFCIVWQNIESMVKKEVPVKINSVALKGINDCELQNFLSIIEDMPIDIRFIEFMPMGFGTIWSKDNFWSAQEIIEGLNKLVTLESDKDCSLQSGPARMWRVRKNNKLSKGRIGIISSVTKNSCASCNRLRLTAEGKLRTCLFDDQDFDLRALLRDKTKEIKDIENLISMAVSKKRIGSEILEHRNGAVANRKMVSIGG